MPLRLHRGEAVLLLLLVCTTYLPDNPMLRVLVYRALQESCKGGDDD